MGISAIFANITIFRILKLLFSEQKSLFNNEISRKIGSDSAQTMRELKKLEKIGLVLSEKKAGKKFYRINQENPNYKPLAFLFELQSNEDQLFIKLGGEENMNLLTTMYNIESLEVAKTYQPDLVETIPRMYYEFKNNYLGFLTQKNIFLEQAEKTKQNLLNKTIDLTPAIGTHRSKYQELLDTYKQIRHRKRFSKEEAIKLISTFRESMNEINASAWPALFDLKIHTHTDTVKTFIKQSKSKESEGILMEKLLAPTFLTITQNFRAELLSIALSESNQEKNLQHLYEDYRWLNFGWSGPEFPFSYFETIYTELNQKEKQVLENELQHIQQLETTTKKQKEQLYKKLNLPENQQYYIEQVALMSWLKLFRKDIVFLVNWMTFYIVHSFTKEINIPNKDVAYYTLDEIYLAIEGKLKLSKNVIATRKSHTIIDPRHEQTKLITGKDAEKLLQQIQIEKDQIPTTIDTLHGTTASLGDTGDWVYGEVKIVNTIEDMKKFKEGDILVSHATNPELLPAMQKASAIVTDQGGITSHAAIVSREMNKVCLTGTKYATKLFKDGDKVIVCPRHSYIKFQ